MSQNDELRARSGSVDSPDPLVDFLYHLMRDHLPTGAVEGIMQQHVFPEIRQGDNVSTFCNGYLANYAKDIAQRLLGPRKKPTERISRLEFCPDELIELRNAVNRQGLGTKLILICSGFLPTFATSEDPAFTPETEPPMLSGGVVGYWHGIPVVQSENLVCTWFVV